MWAFLPSRFLTSDLECGLDILSVLHKGAGHNFVQLKNMLEFLMNKSDLLLFRLANLYMPLSEKIFSDFLSIMASD